MPKSIYETLSLDPLTKTSIIIQLFRCSFFYPIGMFEDMLVWYFLMIFTCLILKMITHLIHHPFF